MISFTAFLLENSRCSSEIHRNFPLCYGKRNAVRGLAVEGSSGNPTIEKFLELDLSRFATPTAANALLPTGKWGVASAACVPSNKCERLVKK